MEYDLKEFMRTYDVDAMWDILSVSELYGWQREQLLSSYIEFRNEVSKAYGHHDFKESRSRKDYGEE